MSSKSPRIQVPYFVYPKEGVGGVYSQNGLWFRLDSVTVSTLGSRTAEAALQAVVPSNPFNALEGFGLDAVSIPCWIEIASEKEPERNEAVQKTMQKIRCYEEDALLIEVKSVILHLINDSTRQLRIVWWRGKGHTGSTAHIEEVVT